jgi:hypothetical protein
MVLVGSSIKRKPSVNHLTTTFLFNMYIETHEMCIAVPHKKGFSVPPSFRFTVIAFGCKETPYRLENPLLELLEGSSYEDY